MTLIYGTIEVKPIIFESDDKYNFINQGLAEKRSEI